MGKLQVHHCDFFDWHDANFCPRAKTVIRMLLGEVEMLLAHGDDDGQSFFEEVDAIQGELRKFRKRYEYVVKEARRSDLKFKIAMGGLLVTWVFFLSCS